MEFADYLKEALSHARDAAARGTDNADLGYFNELCRRGVRQNWGMLKPRQFLETYHRDPDWYGALAWESARALLSAISSSGDARPDSVRTQLAAMKVDSILPGGRLVFGPDQQAIYPYVVQQNQPDGSSPIVFPNDVAEGPGVAVNPKCP